MSQKTAFVLFTSNQYRTNRAPVHRSHQNLETYPERSVQIIQFRIERRDYVSIELVDRDKNFDIIIKY